MLTLTEIIITFAPILIFLLLASVIFWQIAVTGKGKVRALTITSLLIWIFLTLIYCVFTLGYLAPHVGGGTGEYFLAVLIYGIIGLGLVFLARFGKRISQ